MNSSTCHLDACGGIARSGQGNETSPTKESWTKTRYCEPECASRLGNPSALRVWQLYGRRTGRICQQYLAVSRGRQDGSFPSRRICLS
jgi:hypothetical protein